MATGPSPLPAQGTLAADAPAGAVRSKRAKRSARSPALPATAEEVLVANGPPSYIATLEGELTFVNDRYRVLAAFTGKRIGEDALPQEPVFPIGEVVSRVIAGETEVVKRDAIETPAETRHFQSRHFAIRDAEGTITAVGGIYVDATDETAGWAAAAKASERFSDIERLVSDWIWETDESFVLTYVSSRITEVLGRHPRELVGKDLFSIGTFATKSNHPKDSPSPQSRSPFRNISFVMPDGAGHDHELHLSGIPVFNDQGRFSGYRGTATDVTVEAEARKMASTSRERLTAAIENISEGFALFDDTDHLVLFNNRFASLFPTITRLIVPGLHFSGIVEAALQSGILDDTNAEAAETAKAWAGLAAAVHESGAANLEIPLAGGCWLWLSARATDDGGIAVVLSDVTEMKLREDALRESKEEAEQASRAKSQFLANMSHELRTPLNAIIGFSEIMHEQSLGPLGSSRYVEYVDDILDSSRHLLGIINDILEVSKAESGKLALFEEHVDIGNEIASTARLFHRQAEDADIELLNETPDGLPPLLADRRKIRQMLLNLVSNALKFTPAGGHVRIDAHLDADGAMTMAVTDDGIGIRSEDIAAALSPFGQVESSLSRRFEGTGLGLPLTQALAECHQAQLTLKSGEGKGTQVSIRFPAERVLS